MTERWTDPPAWFRTEGLPTDDQRRFLEVLRAAGPVWRELGIDRSDTFSQAWSDGTLVVFIPLHDDGHPGGLGYLDLRVDFDGAAIIAGQSDPSFSHPMDPADPSNVRQAGSVDELASAARDWLEAQLRRPIEVREWAVDTWDLANSRLEHYRYAESLESETTVRAWVFADTGETVAWEDSGVYREGRSGWPVPGTDAPPRTVRPVRPDRRTRA